MTETILRIEEVFGFKTSETDYHNFDGFKITTDKREIILGIDNGQDCCEKWGYFESNDEDFSYFIGADLLDISVVDTALNEKKVKEVAEYGFDGGGIMFVNFKTSKGILQLAVYNNHNGYYGHSIVLKSGNKILKEDVL